MVELSTETTFYRIPLVCEAAPQIGCGCRAKPVLAALEREPNVVGAWLSRSGSVLAVEWRNAIAVGHKLQIVAAALGREAHVEQVIDDRELRALHELLGSTQDWFRAGDVHRLSIEEAGVIARRIAQRLASALRIEPQQLANFESTLSAACSQVLRYEAAASQVWRTERLRQAVHEAATVALGQEALGALKASPSLADHRPNDSESRVAM